MVQSKPYGISFFKYRTVLSYGRRRPHRTVYGWQPYGTCISNTVRYFNSDVENLHRYTVRDSYLNRTGSLLVNRTVLGFQIPYGTWEIYIAKYRTGLSFEPYGITFIRPLRTTLPLAPVRDINLHRTVCSFSGFLIMFLSISRPYYNTKSSWPSSTWHWSLFAFRRTSLHWLFPHQYRHTPYGISTQIFTTVRYFCSCFFHTVRAKKTLKTNFLHKEQTSFPLEKNSIY